MPGPDAGWRGPVGPGDASGVEEAAEPVVVEPSESVAGSFHLFDDQIEPLGGSVRCAGVVMVEDLCPPPGERPSEALDFGHFVGDASSDGLVHEKGRVSWTVDEIDVSDGFFGGSSHLSGDCRVRMRGGVGRLGQVTPPAWRRQRSR